MSYKVKVIGNGVFGSFFKTLIIQHCKEVELVDKDADTYILAIPSDAFNEVTKELKGKHVVNVCSVQEETNKICRDNGCYLTGIHPLFGPRSPEIDRRFVITYESNNTLEYYFLNKLIRVIPNRSLIYKTAFIHDSIMAKTHLRYVQIMEIIKPLLDPLTSLELEIAPNSYLQLMKLVDSLGDMPEGTLSSIKSNLYGT